MILTLLQAKKIKQDYAHIHNKADIFLLIAPNDERMDEYVKFAHEQLSYRSDLDVPIWEASHYALIILVYNGINRYEYYHLDKWLKNQGEELKHKKYGLGASEN